MKCSKLLSTRQFLREFHYSRFWFTHSDWRSLVYIPWFPYKWHFQLIHLIYRWLLVLYFLSWLIVSLVRFSGPLYLIFLTNWAFIVFVLYLLMAALSVTTKFITVHACKRSLSDCDLDRKSDYLFKKPKGCCGYKSNMLSWYQMIQWACFTIGGECALIILILYWSVIYGGGTVDGINANTHLVNGIISVVDVWLTGMPVSLLHFIYPVSFAATYTSFTGIYFAANGTGITGERFIYPVIDYGRIPGTASVTVILLVLLFVPVVHLLFYAMFLARFWLVYAIYGRSKVPCLPSSSEKLSYEAVNAVEMEAQKTEPEDIS